MREPLARFSGFPVVACAHSPSFDALRLGVGCGLGSETPPQDVLSSHSTPERQSLFESHRQRRWLTRWSYSLHTYLLLLVFRTSSLTLIGPYSPLPRMALHGTSRLIHTL